MNREGIPMAPKWLGCVGAVAAALHSWAPFCLGQQPIALRPLPQGLMESMQDSALKLGTSGAFPLPALGDGGIPKDSLWAELRDALETIAPSLTDQNAWDLALSKARNEMAVPNTDRLGRRAEQLLAYLIESETYFRQTGDLEEIQRELPWQAALEGLAKAPYSDDTLDNLSAIAVGKLGMDDEPFPWITEQIERYLDLAYLLREEDPAAIIEEELTALPELWDRSKDLSQVVAEANFAQSLRWLEHVGLNSDFATPFVNTKRYSNGYVRASGQLVTKGWNTCVENHQLVSEVILGTRIRGTGNTLGAFSILLLPDPRKASFLATFQGVNRSLTRGVNGPAIIYSRANTWLSAPIWGSFDGRSIEASVGTPSATAKSQTTGIGSTKPGLIGHIVKRAATKRSAEMRPRGDRIASGRAARKLAKSMSEQLAQGVANANQRIASQIANLEKTGRFPSLLRVRSSRDAVHVNFGFAAIGQLAASAPPAKELLEGDLVVWLHQSLPNNYAASLLSGREFSPAIFQDVMQRRYPQLAQRLPSPSDEQNYELTFADRAPVALTFQNDTIEVLIRSQRLGTSDQNTENVDIKVRLSPTQKNGRLVFVRQAIEVSPARIAEGDGGRLSVREIGEKSKLEDRLKKSFPSEFPLEDILPPPEARTNKLLSPYRIVAREGWLGLAYVEGRILATE